MGPLITVPGLVSLCTHEQAEERRLPIVAKSLGRCGQFIIDAPHKSGLYQFLVIPELQTEIYKRHRVHTGTSQDFLYEILETILARTISGTL